MNSSDYFQELLDSINLKIDDKKRKLIEEKQNLLREKLREKLPLSDDFLTGSYRRHTIIKPRDEEEKFDVDVFIAFSQEEYSDSKLGELRETTINALEEIKDECAELEITNINEGQRRSVGVEFRNNFQIDIVPAVEIENDELYKIFDKNTLDAIESNPKLHSELLSEVNDDLAGLIVPIIKILKSWKREKCDYVKSFHIELLAVELLKQKSIESIPDGIVQFFNDAHTFLQESSLADPANEENLVDAYLDDDGNRGNLLSIIEDDKKIADKALELEQEGEGEAAVRNWRKIFDPKETASSNSARTPVFIKQPPAKPYCNVRFNTE